MFNFEGLFGESRYFRVMSLLTVYIEYANCDKKEMDTDVNTQAQKQYS